MPHISFGFILHVRQSLRTAFWKRRRKKGKKKNKLGWWIQECSAQPKKSEACRQLKYDMTGSDSLLSRLPYKISCKSPRKWPLYLYATDATIVISFILNDPSPGCLTRTEGNFPVVVFYTVYFLRHIKVPWMINFCTPQLNRVVHRASIQTGERYDSPGIVQIFKFPVPNFEAQSADQKKKLLTIVQTKYIVQSRVSEQ